MSGPGKWTQEDIDHDMALDEECWNCGGKGFYFCCEDEIGCIDPDAGCDLCQRRCEYCNPKRPHPPAERTDDQ